MALAVGLQLIATGAAQAGIQPASLHNLSDLTASVLFDTHQTDVQAIAPFRFSLSEQITSKNYSPPDNGGPQDSQGSGTR